MSTPYFDKNWLRAGAVIPVDVETISALVNELKRLKYLIDKTYYVNDAGNICQRCMDTLLADIALDILDGSK